MSTIANVEMARAWDGDEGDRWTEHAERYEATGRRVWQRFLDARPVSAADAVLDIGCGTGESTLDAARIARHGTVLGVDLSARMLARARQRAEAEGLTHVRFEQADAQVHPFETHAFDVAISSFGAMFFVDPVAAFANIARALRPGGRLAVLTWRELARNEWLTALREALAVGRQLPEPPPGAPGPFALADPDRVRAVLGAAGFDEVAFQAVDEPIELGADADDAFSFVRTMGIVHGLTQDLDDATRARALDDVHAMLAAHQREEGVLLGTSVWLITARRP
ncbi:MAG: methyltransferase domain-containing protein [Actinomycetota bacterium]|nr:methyltransferase domain-containing protein [Actinomycetota bacterium]